MDKIGYKIVNKYKINILKILMEVRRFTDCCWTDLSVKLIKLIKWIYIYIQENKKCGIWE